MKTLRIMTIVLFVTVILIPLLFFNFTPDAVSPIDNRGLTGNPFLIEGDLSKNIEDYVNDRIGFRNNMISAYTVLNDAIFGKLVHPSYSNGKDGYVFGAGITTSNNFGEFHIAFADMVKSIQDYCRSRDVPFLFVFNPAKPAIYEDKLANGINYNREWVDAFFDELDKREINYLDNTITLKELSDLGIEGFNKKYDANHWNVIGAFYGTQKMQEQLKEEIPTVHVNTPSEFSFSKTLETTLPVSNFPIYEYVPEVELNITYMDLTDNYFSEIELHPVFKGFNYYVNEDRRDEGSPKVLVFQGSYMNSYGYKYMINSFGEYVVVHDYQNVINFPYYYNIFQPDCVIFEVAEWTLNENYFDYNNMKTIQYNPYPRFLSDNNYLKMDILGEDIVVEKGDALTKITWKTDIVYKYVWICLDGIYDMKAVEGGYQATVETMRYETMADEMGIFVFSEP